MVQLGVIVAIVEARRGAAHLPTDPIVIVHAADREDTDVVVGKPTREVRRVGGLDRRSIRLDMGLDLGMRIAGDTEHADTRGAGALERLQIGRGIPQRWVRALNRAGNHLTRR